VDGELRGGRATMRLSSNKQDIAMPSQQTVLFVDDEVNILKALQRLLRADDMKVLTASRASEALDILEKRPAQVVVTDQRMPEMCGVDFLASVRERFPDVVRMMLTGYTEINVAVDAINRGEIYRLITKPWNDDELRATLRQAFNHASLKAEIKRLNQVTREQNFKLNCARRTCRPSARSPRPWMRRTPTRAATPSGSASTLRRSGGR
jgi:DNA-binding NtrC family response regulator